MAFRTSTSICQNSLFSSCYIICCQGAGNTDRASRNVLGRRLDNGAQAMMQPSGPEPERLHTDAQEQLHALTPMESVFFEPSV